MLLAVHIVDGVLPGPVLAIGFVIAGALLGIGCIARRWNDDETSRIAVLSSAFFVASSIHIPLLPASVHLQLTGIVGVLLGIRAAVAIPLALFLQWALLSHGGITALGVNACTTTVPALLVGAAYHWMRGGWWASSRWATSATLAVAVSGLTLGVIFAVLEVRSSLQESPELPIDRMAAGLQGVLHPASITTALVMGLAAGVWNWRCMPTPEFALGMAAGGLAVLLSASIASGVLVVAGKDWQTVAFLVLLAHAPVAVVEAIVTGFTFQFLAQVKPELINLKYRTANHETSVGSNP